MKKLIKKIKNFIKEYDVAILIACGILFGFVVEFLPVLAFLIAMIVFVLAIRHILLY